MNSVLTANADGRSTRWENHREERRRDLIKAARRAVHVLGSEASMGDIAAAAGTSKSVFYRYFGDKAGLQQAVGEVVLLQMQRKIKEAAQNAQTPRQGLFAMVSAYLHMAQTSPNVYAFVTQNPGPETGPQQSLTGAGAGALGHFFDSIRAMLERPMRAHLKQESARHAGLDYWPAAAIGLVRSAGESWLHSPPSANKPGPEAMARHITAWLCVGIAQELNPAVMHSGVQAAPTNEDDNDDTDSGSPR